METLEKAARMFGLWARPAPIGWRFIDADRLFDDAGNQLAEVGGIIEVEGKVTVRSFGRGLRTYATALDALLGFNSGTIVCRIRPGGRTLHSGTESRSRRGTILAMADASSALQEFGCRCATRMAGRCRNPEAARDAIEVKRRWVRGQAKDRELLEARVAMDAACDPAPVYRGDSAGYASFAAFHGPFGAPSINAGWCVNSCMRSDPEYARTTATFALQAVGYSCAFKAQLNAELESLLGKLLGEVDHGSAS